MITTVRNEEKITQTSFGQLNDGTAVDLYTLTNRRGMQVSISNFGGIITSLYCPDRKGKFDDVVLGFDTLQPYLTNTPYFGALIGRVGNRIAAGRFSLDGIDYQLETNDNGNHLHGGVRGFDKVVWRAEAGLEQQQPCLQLTYLSPDGDQGYPGNLEVEVCYRLTDRNELITEYSAVTDRPTPVTLTQHSYFNLGGDSDILSHRVAINADTYLPLNKQLIPLGHRESLRGTPLDFLLEKSIGADIDSDHPQLFAGAGGYDHYYVINRSDVLHEHHLVKNATVGAYASYYTMAARVTEPISGRVLTVGTTEPGVQFYTGNFLDGSLSGKGRVLSRRSGFCLEPQHFPDSLNQPQFPSCILRPGQVYQSRMNYAFSLLEAE